MSDPDYHALMQMGLKGRAAWGTFVSLVCAARDRDNGGVFIGPLGIAAGLTRTKPKDIKQTIEAITEACSDVGEHPWLIYENGRLTIRSYEKWNRTADNNWGGIRENSGRRLNHTAKNNQDETKMVHEKEQDGSDSTGIGIGTGLGTSDLSGFERFWVAWPKHFRKTKKFEARKTWVSKDLEPLADEIVAGVERWKTSKNWHDDESAYVPLPTSWLNDRCWEDADLVPAAPRKKSLAEQERERTGTP